MDFMRIVTSSPNASACCALWMGFRVVLAYSQESEIKSRKLSISQTAMMETARTRSRMVSTEMWPERENAHGLCRNRVVSRRPAVNVRAVEVRRLESQEQHPPPASTPPATSLSEVVP